MLKLHDMTQSELSEIENRCNFTDEEQQCFELRAKNKSNVQIAQKMNISPARVSVLVKRIKNKIIKMKRAA